jgi:hypothetical protein
MKIEHVDGGPWVVTLSLREASLLCYSTAHITSGCEELPEALEFLRFQSECLRAQLVPGSKDSLEAYGPDQAAQLVTEARAGKDTSCLNYTEQDWAEIEEVHERIKARRANAGNPNRLSVVEKSADA